MYDGTSMLLTVENKLSVLGRDNRLRPIFFPIFIRNKSTQKKIHSTSKKELTQKTPDQLFAAIKTKVTLTKEIDINEPILVEEGVLIFIRFIRSELKLKVFDAVFEVNHELKYSYVVVRIICEKYVLVVSGNEHVYHIFPFVMSAAFK
jgi:hypothetical protein